MNGSWPKMWQCSPKIPVLKQVRKCLQTHGRGTPSSEALEFKDFEGPLREPFKDLSKIDLTTTYILRDTASQLYRHPLFIY